MGARQRAQKREKATKAAKGSLKGSPASQKHINSSVHVHDLSPETRRGALMGWQDFATSGSPLGRSPLFMSMSMQARNTERNAYSWGQTRLRDNAVSFVSAGHLHQDDTNIGEETEKMQAEEAKTIPETGHMNDTKQGLQHEPQEPVPDEVNSAPDIIVETATAEPHGQIRNIEVARPDGRHEQEKGESGSGGSRPRSASNGSTDSEEQIVFTGRQLTSEAPSRNVSAKRPAVQDPKLGRDSPTEYLASTQPIPIATTGRPRELGTELSLGHVNPLSRRDRRRGRLKSKKFTEEEALMQDYIAHMAVDDSGEDENEVSEAQKTSRPRRRNEHFRYLASDGLEHAKVQVRSSAPNTPRSGFGMSDLDQALDWNSEDLEDFDELSTSSEDVDEVEQVLRFRERPSGVQYLVTSKGQTANEAKWILHNRLVSESAQKEIQIYEEIQAMQFEEGSFDDEGDDNDNSSTDDDEHEALEDLIDHIESEDEENGKILRHVERMTDEQIARALAKQEELGLGGDELMLFDGDVGDEGRSLSDLDEFGQDDDFISFSTKQHTSNRGRSKRNKKQRDTFPSAGAFADALDEDPYGGFDIMDFDRPSLRPRKKGRKSGYPFNLELEDEDLKDQLVSTWMKDREKKATRKREKEEARMTATIEASERSHPFAIKQEIRRFLLEEADVLRLAPMESHLRASVHRLAKALKLNSHSEGKEGKGAGRLPILTKTARTPQYTIDTIWEIDALLNTRKFFPKHGSGSYKHPKIPGASTTTRTRRSGGVQGASYMNGEIVGASAPEIGADNRGRALLEKMGWIAGMGIGAEGNKGSLDAIKHVVKTNKAGLG